MRSAGSGCRRARVQVNQLFFRRVGSLVASGAKAPILALTHADIRAAGKPSSAGDTPSSKKAAGLSRLTTVKRKLIYVTHRVVMTYVLFRVPAILRCIRSRRDERSRCGIDRMAPRVAV